MLYEAIWEVEDGDMMLDDGVVEYRCRWWIFVDNATI